MKIYVFIFDFLFVWVVVNVMCKFMKWLKDFIELLLCYFLEYYLRRELLVEKGEVIKLRSCEKLLREVLEKLRVL